MDIKSVHLYQSVIWEKRQEKFFAEHQIRNKKAVEITMHTDISCVEIKSEKDHILVPLSNVSCIYIWTDNSREEIKKSQEEFYAPKSTLRASQIKRPSK